MHKKKWTIRQKSTTQIPKGTFNWIRRETNSIRKTEIEHSKGPKEQHYNITKSAEGPDWTLLVCLDVQCKTVLIVLVDIIWCRYSEIGSDGQ